MFFTGKYFTEFKIPRKTETQQSSDQSMDTCTHPLDEEIKLVSVKVPSALEIAIPSYLRDLETSPYMQMLHKYPNLFWEAKLRIIDQLKSQDPNDDKILIVNSHQDVNVPPEFRKLMYNLVTASSKPNSLFDLMRNNIHLEEISATKNLDTVEKSVYLG